MSIFSMQITIKITKKLRLPFYMVVVRYDQWSPDLLKISICVFRVSVELSRAEY